MYSVFEESGKLRLQSATSVVEILPACGAILNKWRVKLHDATWNIIDGYESVADFKANCETKGFRSCKLSPYVCRIPDSGSYHFDDKDYNIGKYKLGDSSIHGLLYNLPFEVIFTESSEQFAIAVLQHNYDGSDIGYPFPYSMEVTYFLEADNKLSLSTTVTNLHDSDIPMSDGWHPYFALGVRVNELYLEIASNKMLEFNEALIPTGELLDDTRFEFLQKLKTTELDNCFLLHKPLESTACKLVNIEDNLVLSITPDSNYPYLQLYTPPHRNSIAIENLSAAPDAFNNKMGLLVLEPGEQHSFKTSYEVGEWQ